MRWRRHPAPDDPAAVAVEAFLDERATRLDVRAPAPPDRLAVQDALWLCPCYSDEDPPVLLICATEAGEVLWSHVPDSVSEDDLVHAHGLTGAHVHPSAVLEWLHGRRDVPGFDEVTPEDREITKRLRDRLNATAG